MLQHAKMIVNTCMSSSGFTPNLREIHTLRTEVHPPDIEPQELPVPTGALSASLPGVSNAHRLLSL